MSRVSSVIGGCWGGFFVEYEDYKGFDYVWFWDVISKAVELVWDARYS